jgi:nifR3 family TIM-barrel protein
MEMLRNTFQNMLKIADLSVFPLLAAPMAGFSNRAGRDLYRSFGAGAAVSEMVPAKMALENRGRLFRMLQSDGEAGVCAVQLYGTCGRIMGDVCRMLAENTGTAWVDINMGCPMPKIIKTGAGSALLKDAPRVRRIISSIMERSQLPVTVKLRIGPQDNDEHYMEIAEICAEYGVAAVTLHPRSTAAMYEGVSDWTHIGRLRRQLSIPVIGNGDIHSAADAVKMMTETGCAAVMIGRAAIGNPWLFTAVATAFRGEEFSRPSFAEIAAVALRHFELMVRYSESENTEYLRARKILPKYFVETAPTFLAEGERPDMSELLSWRSELISAGSNAEVFAFLNSRLKKT